MHWYAVYTKSHQEQVACENLKRQGFETYLPLMKARVRRRHKWHERIEPMFARYLFIRLEPGTTNTATIRSTRGVTALVRFGQDLVRVPEEFVTSLVQAAEPETGLHAPQDMLVREGDNVVVTNGPFANLTGIFKAADGDERALILLNIMGAATNVVLPREQIWRQGN